jgi:formylglycine-generating enzyme required for sulfatase activity
MEMGSNPSQVQKEKEYPVEGITWSQANEFVRVLPIPMAAISVY